MFSAIDKAVVALVIGALATLNTKYGFHFDTGDQTASVLSGLLDAAVNGLVGFALVWIVPNKGAPK